MSKKQKPKIKIPKVKSKKKVKWWKNITIGTLASPENIYGQHNKQDKKMESYLKKIKIGDLITSYHKGYWVVTNIEKRFYMEK